MRVGGVDGIEIMGIDHKISEPMTTLEDTNLGLVRMKTLTDYFDIEGSTLSPVKVTLIKWITHIS